MSQGQNHSGARTRKCSRTMLFMSLSHFLAEVFSWFCLRCMSLHFVLPFVSRVEVSSYWYKETSFFFFTEKWSFSIFFWVKTYISSLKFRPNKIVFKPTLFTKMNLICTSKTCLSARQLKDTSSFPSLSLQTVTCNMTNYSNIRGEIPVYIYFQKIVNMVSTSCFLCEHFI